MTARGSFPSIVEGMADQRWPQTIPVCPECDAKAESQSVCSGCGFDQRGKPLKWVEVVPVAELERLREALRDLVAMYERAEAAAKGLDLDSFNDVFTDGVYAQPEWAPARELTNI